MSLQQQQQQHDMTQLKVSLTMTHKACFVAFSNKFVPSYADTKNLMFFKLTPQA
jgi:hypothetical protein|tara:strand:- start:412 stop:573 length:162 start_codon:yes stop_codon:yes gene_type:complete